MFSSQIHAPDHCSLSHPFSIPPSSFPPGLPPSLTSFLSSIYTFNQAIYVFLFSGLISIPSSHHFSFPPPYTPTLSFIHTSIRLSTHPFTLQHSVHPLNNPLIHPSLSLPLSSQFPLLPFTHTLPPPKPAFLTPSIPPSFPSHYHPNPRFLRPLPPSTSSHHFLPPLPPSTSSLHFLPPLPPSTSSLHFLPPLPSTTSSLHFLPPLPPSTSSLHFLPPLPPTTPFLFFLLPLPPSNLLIFSSPLSATSYLSSLPHPTYIWLLQYQLPSLLGYYWNNSN